MQNEESEAVRELTANIKAVLNKRRNTISWDFGFAHGFFWLSILASFSSSILVANKELLQNYALEIAIIAGIPGLVVSIEKTFDFTRRAIWGISYELELKRVLNEMKFNKLSGYEASIKFFDIIQKNEEAFNKIGFFEQASHQNERKQSVPGN